MKIGFVIADNYEFDPFKKFAGNFSPTEYTALGNNCIKFNFNEKVEVCGVECGIGKVNAAVATLYLVKEEKAGPVELATISFGQRFEITPLQMITAVSALLIISCGLKLYPSPLSRPMCASPSTASAAYVLISEESSNS